MKAIFLCLVALSCCLSLFAQQPPSIVFKVIGGQHKKIEYTRPVEGKYFPDFPKEDTLNANGELVLPNAERVAGVYCFIYKRMYRL